MISFDLSGAAERGDALPGAFMTPASARDRAAMVLRAYYP